MKRFFLLAGVAGGVVLGVSGTAAAATGPFSLSIKGGAQYDDNITVSAQDLATNEGDVAAVIDGSAGVKLVNRKAFHVSAGYDFYQTLHRKLTQFDMQIHGLSLTVGGKIGGVDVGNDVRFDHVLLGGHGFLDIESVRPNVGFSLGPVYLTADYEYQYRNFSTLFDNRDAHHHRVGTMAYFSPAPGVMLNAGYSLVREVAAGPEFDFWGHYFDAGVKATLPLPVLHPTFRLAYRYKLKDFSNITPSIGVRRHDRRSELRTSVELPVVAGFDAELKYKFVKSDSNLPILNYHENVVTLTLGWKL